MESLKGHDAWKTNAPEPPEIDWDGLQENLEACPFCANDQCYLDSTGMYSAVWCVRCDNCGTKGPTTYDPDRSAEFWNSRS